MSQHVPTGQCPHSVLFTVSLPLSCIAEHPERTLVLKALYVNDTAVKAEVYRDHVTEVITDALVALRLNTSPLLHSRVHWRPQAFSELQV